ncbi:MAG: AbrB/MazE/SpoVT family DNA-binding domain-containing protein [candidate division WS1 bacterium]|nr:AbrB/MazE/SpoVT family DNA-binding domain-containing protein [candidate division WS1 bacterium]
MFDESAIEEQFVGAVTVGERGQVVIPAEARETMGLSPGDKLLVFNHPTGEMVCLCKLSMLERVAAFLNRLQQEEGSTASDDA